MVRRMGPIVVQSSTSDPTRRGPAIQVRTIRLWPPARDLPALDDAGEGPDAGGGRIETDQTAGELVESG